MALFTAVSKLLTDHNILPLSSTGGSLQVFRHRLDAAFVKADKLTWPGQMQAMES